MENKGVQQDGDWWVPDGGLGPWRSTSFFLLKVTVSLKNIFPFPVSFGQIVGDFFYTFRERAANRNILLVHRNHLWRSEWLYQTLPNQKILEIWILNYSRSEIGLLRLMAQPSFRFSDSSCYSDSFGYFFSSDLPVVLAFRSFWLSGRSGFPVVLAFWSFWLSGRSDFPVVLAFRSFQPSGCSSCPVILTILRSEKCTEQYYTPRVACCQRNRQLIFLNCAETEYVFYRKTACSKEKKNVGRRGPRQILFKL